MHLHRWRLATHHYGQHVPDEEAGTANGVGPDGDNGELVLDGGELAGADLGDSLHNVPHVPLLLVHETEQVDGTQLAVVLQQLQAGVAQPGCDQDRQVLPADEGIMQGIGG